MSHHHLTAPLYGAHRRYATELYTHGLLFLLESHPSCELHLAAIGTCPPRPSIGENLLRVEFDGWFLRPTLAEMFDLPLR